MPVLNKANSIIKSFSFTQKLIFWILILILSVSVLSMLFKLNSRFLVEIPQYGGELKEGVIGSPRFVNPVLALSDTDKDLTALLYSGLMRIDDNGMLIPDLAESYEISEDGLAYTFTLKDDLVFHDKTTITTDDIIYTIQMIMDPVVKSPLRGNWEGITVEKISDVQIVFHLPEPYSPFLFNTTLGILPKHIWQSVTPEEFAFNVHNTEPIGSGPYEIRNIRRNQSGVIETYILNAFDHFALGRPYIKEITVSIFKNSEELKEAILNKRIGSGHTLHPEEAVEISENDLRIENIPLPRVFGVFYNQNKVPALSLKSLRRALDASIDREEIIESVFHGYGKTSSSIIPDSLVPPEESTTDNDSDNLSPLEEANQILTSAGWEKDADGRLFVETEDGTFYAGFSLATSNVPELVAVGEKIVATWRQLGVDADLKIFEVNDISNTVIRPREFDALLFGEVVGRDLDLYAFWHSSQRNDPGLNIAGYTNISTDNLLEEARKVTDYEKRIELYHQIEKEIENDLPASLLYSPDFIYALDKKVKAAFPKTVVYPAERFVAVHKWFIDTETVWKIFDGK